MYLYTYIGDIKIDMKLDSNGQEDLNSDSNNSNDSIDIDVVTFSVQPEIEILKFDNIKDIVRKDTFGEDGKKEVYG
jgi:hypothetical protein